MTQKINYFYELQEFLNSSFESHQILDITQSGNQFGDEGTSAIAFALANCTNLSNLKLNLSGNQISAEQNRNTRTYKCTQNMTQKQFYFQCLYIYLIMYFLGVQSFSFSQLIMKKTKDKFKIYLFFFCFFDYFAYTQFPHFLKSLKI
ncbi:transmembrane protein, putative (macronuclear) [Tetrahymena thermophila SB210]|uniref:Transmembrane protein, putative n=1 Tax=Tetrahymena thermophila (strain SB210) TaxID=312017 RepID=W7XJ28_TETTS|nr:transmembrane protein, putative [Tetrahymena thermophila SB210]EWS75156.1 transmembrane protein, putative [Tetrahymena thermophila SB210]|eukprot:XP_012652312.1 transmembrane protein, putative [Tetrahymena thermophila SB210]